MKPISRSKIRTLGHWVCAWIEKYLVHAEGDWYGQPFRLSEFHRRFIHECYALNDDGSRRYARALLGLPKGNAKTEVGAALALCELAGPVMFDDWRQDGRPVAKARTSPDIPVSAASFEQANTLFSAARSMVTAGPLASLFECYETEIRPRSGAGKLYRVAAVAGTNDGRRPTFFVADEIHEWDGPKERVHLVLSNGRAKRLDAWELNISTAGWNLETLLGRMYRRGMRIADGLDPDPTFLMRWLSAPVDCPLETEEQIREAVRSCNPGVGHWLDEDAIVRRFYEVPEYEFRRYYLNQWVQAPERWIPAESWSACADPSVPIPDGSRIVLGFDGSWSGDSTAVVGCTLSQRPHLFQVAAWEKPEGASTWRVDVDLVEHTIRDACRRWQVVHVACDPHRWQRSLRMLMDEGLPMVEWPSHQAARMSPACTQFLEGVMARRLSHDGSPELTSHVANCVVRIDSRGPRIVKETKDSPHKIDLAVAAVIAYDMAYRQETEQLPVPRIRRLD